MPSFYLFPKDVLYNEARRGDMEIFTKKCCGVVRERFTL